MSFLRGLRPEFGYFCPSPNLRRKLSAAVGFTVGGLVVCASSVVLLVAAYDPDPRSALALAPLQSSSRETATPAATAERPVVKTGLAQKVTKVHGIESCQRKASDDADASCDSGAARKPSVLQAVTAPPAPAEIPVGHGNGSAVGASEPAVLVASTPSLKEGTPGSTEAAPPSSKPRKTVRRQNSRRYSYGDSSVWSFDRQHRRGGYARQPTWSFFR